MSDATEAELPEDDESVVPEFQAMMAAVAGLDDDGTVPDPGPDGFEHGGPDEFTIADGVSLRDLQPFSEESA